MIGVAFDGIRQAPRRSRFVVVGGDEEIAFGLGLAFGRFTSDAEFHGISAWFGEPARAVLREFWTRTIESETWLIPS